MIKSCDAWRSAWRVATIVDKKKALYFCSVDGLVVWAFGVKMGKWKRKRFTATPSFKKNQKKHFMCCLQHLIVHKFFYFINTKYTARIRHTKAAKWFQCSDCPWNRRFAIPAKTMSDTTSWITLSWTSVKGPPLSIKPIRLAGTWQQYSKKAMHHENAMTPISGQLLLTPVCWSFRCPYQARVMKMLLASNSSIVYNAFILFIFRHSRYIECFL